MNKDLERMLERVEELENQVRILQSEVWRLQKQVQIEKDKEKRDLFQTL